MTALDTRVLPPMRSFQAFGSADVLPSFPHGLRKPHARAARQLHCVSIVAGPPREETNAALRPGRAWIVFRACRFLRSMPTAQRREHQSACHHGIQGRTGCRGGKISAASAGSATAGFPAGPLRDAPRRSPSPVCLRPRPPVLTGKKVASRNDHKQLIVRQ